MSHWVARQGLFFQLRYASAVKGAESTVFGALMRLVFRLALLVLLLLLGFWLFLVMRVDFGWFRDDLGENISGALRADSVMVGSVKRERGEVVLPKVSLEGGEQSFFYDAELRDVRTRMGLLDGVMRDWDGEVIFIRDLVLSLKSGADTDERASAAYEALFRKPGKFSFKTIEVETATLNWGYSEMHRGGIEGARLKASRRQDGGWNLVFTGGTFSQNWLKRFSIERIEAVATEDRLEFVEMRLSKDGGTVELSGLVKKGGARPEFEGSGRLVGLPIWAVVDGDYREFIDGQISGEISFGGSTNSQDGFSTEIEVQLEGGDYIMLEDRFPLFRAISAIDRLRSYKKVRFSGGSFRMKTGGDRLELSEVALRAQELMRLEGDLVVRLPTTEEIEAQMEPAEEATVGETGEEEPDVEEEKDLTLAELARMAELLKGKEDPQSPGGGVLQRGRGGAQAVDDLKMAEAMRVKEEYYLEGLMRIGITADVFDRSPELNANYPVDSATDLRWLDLKIKGQIFTVGADLANRIYLQSRGE